MTGNAPKRPQRVRKKTCGGRVGPFPARATRSVRNYWRTLQSVGARAPLLTGGAVLSDVKQSMPQWSPPKPRTPVWPALTGVPKYA